MNSLEKDTDHVVEKIDQKLKHDRETRSQNMSRQLKSSFFALTAFLIFVCTLLSLVPVKLMNQYLGKDVGTIVQRNLVRIFYFYFVTIKVNAIFLKIF